MLKRGYKLIISVVLVFTLLFSCCSAFASAEVLAGAGILVGALGSLGVELLAGGAATAAMLIPFLNGDWSLSGILTGVADGYIKVADDSVTIDGVVYDSIFLSPSMAAELHTQAFDFITQYAITSNSSGLLANGIGYWDGVPMFETIDGIYSQIYEFTVGSPFAVGNSNYTSGERVYNTYISMLINGSSAANYIKPLSGTIIGQPGYFRWYSSTSNLANAYKQAFSTYSDLFVSFGGLISGLGVLDSFDFSYVSGTIDADPLPSDYGFQSYVPHSLIDQYGITPGTYDPTTQSGTDIINAILKAIDEAKENDAVLNEEFVETLDPPVPPVPVPTDALGDVPYDTWLDTFGQSVYSKLDALRNVFDIVGSAIESALEAIEGAIDTVGQSVVTAVNNARTVIDSIGQSVITLLQGIRTAIGTAVTDIVSAVDAVTDAVEGLAENIIEDIETAPINIVSTALDVIKLAFAPIIAALRACIGLWHYVVEWVQATAPVFSTFIGFMSGTSYNMVLPIYAALAGPIVIAVYKRFGK